MTNTIGRRVRGSTLLAACALATACGPSGAYDHGQALSWLGMDPTAGDYNPALARCEVTTDKIDSVEVRTYDRHGRLSTVSQSGRAGDSVTESSWDGPCRELQRTTRDGYVLEYAYTCDRQGWPVTGASSEDTGQGAVTARWTIANDYDGDTLVRATRRDEAGDVVETSTYTWEGGRLASVALADGSTTTYAWRPDGWIAESVEDYGAGGADPYVQTWTYDDRDRLIEHRSNDRVTHTYTYAGGERWPFTVAYAGAASADLVYDCL